MEKDKTIHNRKNHLRYRCRTKRAVDIRELRGLFIDLAENEEWDELINAIQPMLKAKPRDHWLLTQGALAYYQKKDYNGAVVYAADALTIEFGCPLAQVIFGKAMLALGETKEALEFLEPLIVRGMWSLARGRCGEGSDCNINVARAKVLIEEARSAVGMSMMDAPSLRGYAQSHDARMKKNESTGTRPPMEGKSFSCNC